MNKRLALFIAVGLIGLATVSLAVTAYIQRLPDPEHCDRQGLLRWLVDADLSEQPSDIQLQLLRRAEEELAAGIDFHGQQLNGLSDARRTRLMANADRLAQLWFLQAADEYAAAPRAARAEVLARQAADLRRLRILEQLSALDGRADGGPTNRMAAIGQSIERVERWIDAAPAGDRARLRDYLAALRARLIWDGLRGMFSH